MQHFYRQLLIFFCGIILIVFLYNLPKDVVGANEKSLEASSVDNSIENALMLVNSNNPMSGVFMLREILEKEPKNKEALFHLGVLSIKSKQYTNAIERFNQLLIIDSLDKRPYLHLGISNFELGKQKEADFFFNKIVESKDDLLIKQLNLFLNEKKK